MTRDSIQSMQAEAHPLPTGAGGPDVTFLLPLLDGASVIGIGEPTHGDATSLQLKQALIAALANKAPTPVVAWERGPGHVTETLNRLHANVAPPEEQMRFLYPWVSGEAHALFEWLARTDTPEVHGIDMDGPVPHTLFDTLAVPDPDHARALMARSRGPEPEHAALRALESWALAQARNTNLAPRQQILVSSTAQWARFRLATLSDDPDAGRTAQALRDGCMADNVLDLADHSTPVIFSAHNGHVSRKSNMAGGRLLERLGESYRAVGMAFGTGSFCAGTAKGDSFDPKLVVFDADRPPPGSFEQILAQYALHTFCLDLRPLRGTGHPLARPCLMREVSLAGGRPQFSITATPADLYDIVIWMEAITPVTVRRGPDSFW
ncbi:erythromycin esterase family protein [Primorskyibacter sp. 2E107]|uniref:erythromycin esterase family protein n=1 Tax=Primorskyibacter sp. 2E107 TaxID=3403458 RepID=UPI003AF972B0